MWLTETGENLAIPYVYLSDNHLMVRMRLKGLYGAIHLPVREKGGSAWT